MRITQLSTFNGFQKQLQNNRQELAKYQEQLSTNKRVVRPSDDNIAFGTSRQIRESIRKNEQYQSNISAGLNHARNTQEALDGMVDILIDFKNTAINGSNDSLEAGDRENLADKVASLKDKLIDLGNSDFNGTYIFGGTNTAESPFSTNAAAAGGVDDSSTNRPLKIQASRNSEIETTITGTELRNTGAGDLFGIMKTVEDALRVNDRNAVSGALDDVDQAIDHVTGLASKNGSNINRMNFISSQFEAQSIEQKGEVSRLTDTDVAETITNFKKLETSYQAALAVHSRISQSTLLNYI